MKIYAIIGESTQVIDETKDPKCPEGHIEMKSPRPEGDYVAAKGGKWVVAEQKEDV